LPDPGKPTSPIFIQTPYRDWLADGILGGETSAPVYGLQSLDRHLKCARQAEYDPPDDRYSRVIVDELLPRLYAQYRITRDPERHAIAGWSSGAIAAFTVAWERPDQFRKVLSGIGAYVNLAGGHVYPEKVMASERKPIRIS
jgi:enterochelin esterase-like enzyme